MTAKKVQPKNPSKQAKKADQTKETGRKADRKTLGRLHP